MVLKISISGVRGIVDNGLDERVAFELGASFGTYLHLANKAGVPKVAIARDTRPSGERLEAPFIDGLIKTGCSVLKFGVVPTPTAQVNVSLQGLSAAVVVSASHNPIEWNGFKFIGPRGIFLNEKEANTFLRIYHSKRWTEGIPGNISEDMQGALVRHMERVFTKLKIAGPMPSLKVALDAVNGAGSVAGPRLLDFMGMESHLLYCDGSGNFLRGAEPLPENLNALAELVRNEHCDIGFAQDPDADRLAIVDENGVPLGEDLTLVLGLEALIEAKPKGAKTLVVNLSTSMAVDLMAAKHGATVVRTPIGEVHVSEGILAHKAFAGGEGNGGLINPDIGMGRDSLGGMATILQYLIKNKIKISQWAAPYRKFKIIKDKVTLDPHIKLEALLGQIKNLVNTGVLDERDGIKITWPDRWLHVRASNTEPIVRIMAESADPIQAQGLIDQARAVFSKI